MLKSIVNGAEHDIVSIPMKTRNLFDESTATYGKYINPEGVETVSTTGETNHSDYIPVQGNTVYTISATKPYFDSIISSISWYDENKIFIIRSQYSVPGSNGRFSWSATSPINAVFAIINFQRYPNFDGENDMFNIGSTALPYEPYGYQNGWEVRDNQNRLIWGREGELQTTTGTLMFKGYDIPIKVKSLLGNATQNGTPSPDNPVVPEFCGVRTENLFPLDTTKLHVGRIENDGTINYKIGTITVGTNSIMYQANETWGGFYTDYIRVNENEKITFSPNNSSITSWGCSCYDENDNFLGKASNQSTASTRTFTMLAGTKKVRISVTSSLTEYTIIEPMLNIGSTALPYEHYGYKITFDNNGENLFDKVFTSGYHLATNGKPTAYTNDARCAILEPIDVSSVNTVTFSFTNAIKTDIKKYMYSLFDGSALITRVSNLESGSTIDVSQGDKLYLSVYSSLASVNAAETTTDIMLNSGSTPLPYSPYLNKTTPIYLGEVPTIRRIKKLVLTGNEPWAYESAYTRFYTSFKNTLIIGVRSTPAFCTHFQVISDRRQLADVPNDSMYSNSVNSVWFFKKTEYTDVDAWKSYLSAQYQNGTPVTVWYILANPQTGIVNEPLAKIGDYADELTEISVHNLSAPLYGIGDYKDTLNLSTGVVTRNVKKLVLDGTESWYKNGNTYLIRFGTIKSLSPGIGLISTNYPPEGTTVNVRQYTSTYWSSTLTPVIGIRDESHTSVTDFKAFLAVQYASGSPVTVWYVLAESETETVTVPTGMTGEIEGYLTQISTPTPEHPSIPKWNGKEETGGTYAVTVYDLPEISTTTGKNKLTVNTTLAPYNVTIDGHIKYTYWGKIREDVRSGLAQTKFPVGTILYDNEDATTGRAFQVVGYDKHFDPSLTARGYTHSMTLCQLKLSGPWQYDAIEAFLYTTVEMQPGTYKFKIPNYDTTYGGNKTYYFTSTASVPVYSQIVLKWDYQKPPASVTAYAGPNPQTNTTPLTGFNALTLTEWVEGESPEAIDLGTIKLSNNDPDSAYGKLNNIHRARYGSNNYYQSGLRQLLNTDLTANNWWHPTTIFDRPYANRTTNGYLRSLNEDFINVLATPEITHITNNIFEYPSLDGRTFALNTEYKINTDKVFLLSHTEVGLSSSPNVGTILDYYSTHNTNNDRIKYRIDNGNAYYWWFRTPYPPLANSFRYCSTSGALGYNGAVYSYGVAPAHIIQ